MQLNEQRHNQIAEDFHGDERRANQRENVQPDAAVAAFLPLAAARRLIGRRLGDIGARRGRRLLAEAADSAVRALLLAFILRPFGLHERHLLPWLHHMVTR